MKTKLLCVAFATSCLVFSAVEADANSGSVSGGGCEATFYNQRTPSGSTATTGRGNCLTVGIDAVPFSDFFSSNDTIDDFDEAQGPASIHGLGLSSIVFVYRSY
jgi:hypothetical protein